MGAKWARNGRKTPFTHNILYVIVIIDQYIEAQTASTNTKTLLQCERGFFIDTPKYGQYSAKAGCPFLLMISGGGIGRRWFG
jgi:hypothetical protein